MSPCWYSAPFARRRSCRGRGRGHGAHVAPLSPEETAEIVRQVLGDVELGSASLSTLVERSDGVPLYAEELARGLAEHAANGLAVDIIPASLHDSFTARLDRLGGRKRFAQVGALLGRAFPHHLLAAVLNLPERDLRSGIDELVARQILHRDGLPPRATYTFHHALLQDVAAGSMLRQRRRDEHARIADVLVTRFAEDAAEQPEIVGHHFAEAGEPDAAIDWFARAGFRATERAEFQEAVVDYDRAIALLKTLPVGQARDAREDRPPPRLVRAANHVDVVRRPGRGRGLPPRQRAEPLHARRVATARRGASWPRAICDGGQ